MTDSGTDFELELLKKKKLSEMERKLQEAASTKTKPPETVDPWAVVGSKLVGRGREILDAARAQYPAETDLIIKRLAELITAKIFNEPLSGELLFAIFRRLGLDVRLETRIVYSKHGEVKSLAEKLMEDRG